LARAAAAEIVSAELFLQHIVAVDNPFATLNLRFRWPLFNSGGGTAAFDHRLKRMAVRRIARGLCVA